MEAMQTSTEPLSFESVMAAFREVAEKQKEVAEHQKESDKRLEKMFRETDERRKESDERLEKMFREGDERQKKSEKHFNKLFGEYGNRLGELVEHLVTNNTMRKFRKLGFEFDRLCRNVVIQNKGEKFIAEIDVVFENHDIAMLIEVKTKPEIDDIKDHVERMEKVKAYAVQQDDKRKFFGAIAGIVFKENEKNFAMKNGFYVIEPAGETLTITAPKGEYSPREW